MVAPGLFLMIGTPWVVSIGGGAQLVPNLRTVTPSSASGGPAEPVLADAFRLGLVVGVDLPLIQL